MKEHEDSVDKSTVDSTGVDKTVTEKDEGEDMMVDVVGSGAVEEDDGGGTGVSLDSNSGSEKVECVRKEPESRDQVMEDVKGSGKDCDVSHGIRVLASEKDEVVVKEGEVTGSVETKVLIDVESVEEVADRKIADSSVLTTNLGSEEVDMVVEEGSVDTSLVCGDNQSSAVKVAGSRTDEIDERVKEDSLHPSTEVKPDDAQKTTVGDCVVNAKLEKENEVLDSSKISEPLVTVNPGSEDIDVVVVTETAVIVEKVKEAGEGEINVHAENLDQEAKVDNLREKEGFNPTSETITKTAVRVEQENEAGLNKNEEVMEQPTEPVQDVAYGNGVMDDKTEKGNEVVDSDKIPESLTTVNLSLDGVNSVPPNADTVEHPIVSREDADVDRGDAAGMDIDEVLGWKDEVSGIDVTANSEANVEQKLLGSSNEPVLIQHREEHVKSREPIVYGRRAHVEVPLYESRDVEQKLPESSSPVSEDENLKIETDSEEDDDDDDGSGQEDEQKADREKPELHGNRNMLSLHQSSYFKPPENEGEFSVSDLVWGKVRSHPWWPGQIIDPSNASKKAMKYYKKDSFLVAYFGDHSFAWNSSSVLKPFHANFSQLEKQTDTEIFKIAANCALEEVSRRVELGLACSCVPKEIYKTIEYQVIENAGVKKQSEKRRGKDESASVSSFEPDKLVDYVRLLAQGPAQGGKLDLAITKAQLSSYSHYKGHRELPEFLDCGDMLEDVSMQETVKKVEKVRKKGGKSENDLTESVNLNKEIILSDITDDAPAPASVGRTSKLVSSSGSKKRKARVSISNGSVKKPNRPAKKVSPAPVSTPKPSFKIGEMIQRVASQLTGPVVKSGSDAKVDLGQHVDQIVQTPENSQTGASASAADMLSQLHLTAQDPMKDHSFFQTIIPFFYERRAAVFTKSLKKPSTVEQPDNDTKPKPSNENDPEEFDFDFDFDDVNDSYWTDRIIQNHTEDQPVQVDDQNGAVEEQQPIVEYEPEKPAKRKRRSSKKQKRVEPEPEPEVEEESEIDRKRRENLATEIVLKFEEGINFRSEVQLNKMFRRFGPLMESETEVDRAGGRARVVFKRCFDAEVAHNSAGRFNIFGSVNVSYELNYSPLVSYKPLPLPVLEQEAPPVLEQEPPPVLEQEVPRVLEQEVPVLQEDPMDAS
ncbi:putative non-specific serine/threonine protein kinase [Helianthus annuus]|nr:putative non-specific serine/threonine protein kinase [Helianthus annuus]